MVLCVVIDSMRQNLDKELNNPLMKCFLFTSNSQVSYISQDCEEIPEFLGRKYGHMAKRLDLSFNLLRYVAIYRFPSAIWDTNSKCRIFIYLFI